MTQFKVGDKVKILANSFAKGYVGVVERVNKDGSYGISFPDCTGDFWFLESEIESVKEEKEPEWSEWEIIGELSDEHGTYEQYGVRKVKRNTVHRRMWMPGGHQVRVSVEQIGGEYQWNTLSVQKV